MRKIFSISDKTAIQVEPIKMSEEGETLISIRKMYRKKGMENWLPSNQGLTIPADETLLKKLVGALKAAFDASEDDDVKVLSLKQTQKKGKKSSEEEGD